MPSEDEEFIKFTSMHPGYLDTLVIDELREEEYEELKEDGHVCLDYSGYGLFSQLQQDLDSSSSSFAIAHIPGDLSEETLRCRGEEGTVEFDIRRRIMRFLNIREEEYGMVFTSSKGAAFKLLGESYPFGAQRSLLAVYDYESEALSAMQERAESHGARTHAASFIFPSLSVCATHLKDQILCTYGLHSMNAREDIEIAERQGDIGKMSLEINKNDENEDSYETHKRKDGQKGLFVFPVQSRVSGTRYSYQWMSLAQDNGWHVLLDASGLGPKDMDSLGLSLFQPDFIVTSFYKVFGSDPTGFGCLFVKLSSMSVLSQSIAVRNIGMVRIIPMRRESSPNNQPQEVSRTEDDSINCLCNLQEHLSAQVAFSGPASILFRRKCMESDNSFDSNACLKGKNEDDSAEVRLATASVDVIFDVNALQQDEFSSQGHMKAPKSSIPVTPRSVLEESPLRSAEQCGHVGESHQQDQRGKDCKLVKHEGKIYDDSNDASQGKGTLSEGSDFHPGNMEFMQLTAHNALTRRKILMNYSHEIACSRSNSKHKIAFSQPLVLPDISEDLFLINSKGFSLYNELYFSSSLYDDHDDYDYDVVVVDDDDDEYDVYDDIDDEHEDEISEWDSMNEPFEVKRREPEIYCRGLNHADSLGLNKTNDRLKFLTNWLITSMMKLQHMTLTHYEPLVHLYGPKANYERGASLAFNLFDPNGLLVRPSLVQELGQRNNISLGLAMLSHISSLNGCSNSRHECLYKGQMGQGSSLQVSHGTDRHSISMKLQVVTATLGLFTNFEDVYKLWAFVAKFLDSEFVDEHFHGILQH
ncbi:hypothetical protein KP509_05G019800 [Ceratopteris richardii]|nr:hypothetical protein KP509_05G019800 [Ceratopteris richardii]